MGGSDKPAAAEGASTYRQRRVPAFEGIRGLALLPIIYEHAALGTPLGPFALEIFFVLSGFLIGGILMDTVGTPGWFGRFFERRVRRIWPLYYVVLAVLVVSDPFVRIHSGLNPWLLAVLLGNIAPLLNSHHHRWGAILWSVSLEEQFYLLLPPIVALLRRSLLPFALVGLVVLSVVCRHEFAVTQTNEFCFMFPLCRLDGFSIGALAAWVVRYRPGWSRFATPLAIVAGALEAYAMHQGPLWERSIRVGDIGAIAWTDVAVWQTMSSLFAAGLVVALNGGQLAWARWLRAPLVYLGTISYGMYLFHGMVLEWAKTHLYLSPVKRFVWVALVTIVPATLSWFGMERRLLARGAPSTIAKG
jgi:peptidoglycan/LPS O-acetylase OafA/YrhL